MYKAAYLCLYYRQPMNATSVYTVLRGCKRESTQQFSKRPSSLVAWYRLGKSRLQTFQYPRFVCFHLHGLQFMCTRVRHRPTGLEMCSVNVVKYNVLHTSLVFHLFWERVVVEGLRCLFFNSKETREVCSIRLSVWEVSSFRCFHCCPQPLSQYPIQGALPAALLQALNSIKIIIY